MNIYAFRDVTSDKHDWVVSSIISSKLVLIFEHVDQISHMDNSFFQKNIKRIWFGKEEVD